MKSFFQGRILLWCFVNWLALLSFINASQKYEMLQPACDYGKMKINDVQSSFDMCMCTILSGELGTNNVGIKRDSCILSVTFIKIEFLTCRLYANAFHLLLFGFEHF